MNKHQKGSAKMAVVVSVVAVALIVGYFVFQSSNTLPIDQPQEEGQVVDETANWQTYRNEEFGFEFKYPSSAFGVLSVVKIGHEDNQVTKINFQETTNFSLKLDILKISPFGIDANLDGLGGVSYDLYSKKWRKGGVEMSGEQIDEYFKNASMPVIEISDTTTAFPSRYRCYDGCGEGYAIINIGKKYTLHYFYWGQLLKEESQQKEAVTMRGLLIKSVKTLKFL